MINIKLWWSLFCPKDKPGYINFNFLKNFWESIGNINQQIILHHWTWNVWHWFVKQYGISDETISIWRQKLQEYFNQIDQTINWFQRTSAYEFINKKNLPNTNLIIWWDIAPDHRIISSDETFSYTIKAFGTKFNYILTDVDWVLDKSWNIINSITKDNIDQLKFWEKNWDVTWSMWNKIKELFQLEKATQVWIINWFDLDNFKAILETNDWRWSKIMT